MSNKQCDSKPDTQVATTRHSVDITDQIYKRYWERHAGTEIFNDDTWRNQDTRKSDAEKGFLAEATLLTILEERVGEEHVDWQGNKGEADIQLFNEINLEVKCRDTKTQRNLIIDEAKLDHSEVDLYIHTILHRDMLSEKPVSLEILGQVSREEAVDKRTEIEDGMYGLNREEKYEVHPRHLGNFAMLVKTLEMYANDDPSKILKILKEM